MFETIKQGTPFQTTVYFFPNDRINRIDPIDLRNNHPTVIASTIFRIS